MSHVRVSSQVTVEGNMLTPWKPHEWLDGGRGERVEVEFDLQLEAEESQVIY